MIVINSAGWYLISSKSNVSIGETINNLKQNTNDTFTLHNKIYYYEETWPENNNFSNTDWKDLDISIDINNIYLNSNLAFWVLVTSYTVAPPEPEAEPGSEPIAETGALDISSWLQIGSDIDGVSSSDNLGWSVAMNSDATRIVTGAPGSDIAVGHVRVYDWDGSNWTQIGYIVGEASGDNSGQSVAMSSNGTRIAIGANRNDGVNGGGSGHVRVYDYNGSSWTQVGGDIDGEGYGDESGYSVAMSSDGTRIVIGAIENDGNGNDSGHVRVYEYDEAKTTAVTDQNSSTFGPIGWNRVGGDIDGEAQNDYSGSSVAMNSSGTRIAIGATGNDGSNTRSGHVRVYEYDATKTTAVTDQTSSTFGPIGWNRLIGDIDGEAAYDYSGYSVAMNSSGTRIVIGTESNTGPVRVYEFNDPLAEPEPEPESEPEAEPEPE